MANIMLEMFDVFFLGMSSNVPVFIKKTFKFWIEVNEYY